MAHSGGHMKLVIGAAAGILVSAGTLVVWAIYTDWRLSQAASREVLRVGRFR